MPFESKRQCCRVNATSKHPEPAAAASFQLSMAVYTAMSAPNDESPAPLVLRTFDGFKKEGNTMGLESSDMARGHSNSVRNRGLGL